jgi:ubiquinone/menaquinone biosynthesis C-methylase UbiE
VSKTTHSGLILDQFTRQAPAFSAAAMITDDKVLARIVEFARAQPVDTVLDVACGPGLVVCAFAPHVCRATGIDFTPAMLDRARVLAAEKGIRNVAWDEGDAYHLPYDDDDFSIVVTRYSLHHLLDPQAAFREMVRVYAPGGRIVVVDAYAPEDRVQAAAYHRVETLRDPSHARAFSLTELRELFPRAGLPKPEVALYELPVELRELLARAFPNSGDEAELVELFSSPDAADRLGIPVCREAGKVHIVYQAAILVADVRRTVF